MSKKTKTENEVGRLIRLDELIKDFKQGGKGNGKHIRRAFIPNKGEPDRKNPIKVRLDNDGESIFADRPLEDFEVRMIFEFRELNERTNGLMRFLNNEESPKKTSALMWQSLHEQYKAMKTYRSCLYERLVMLKLEKYI